MRYVRNDALVATLAPGDRAYEVRDDSDRLLGVVAGSGALWAAGRVSPLRSRPFTAVVVAETRKAATERLIRGRP